MASDWEVGTEEKAVGPSDLRAAWRAAMVSVSVLWEN